MKHAFRPFRAAALCAALMLSFVALISAPAQAQTLSPTPDSLVVQITSTTVPAPSPTASPSPSPSPGPTVQGRNSFASDVSGNGRFVVIESMGDIGTKDSSLGLNPDNRDGNPEIFLFDYAQRRIFQITNTQSALKSATGSPLDPANVDVEIVNLRPMISRDGRFIVFISNAYSDAASGTSPKNFNGNNHAAALKADGNTEIFIYAIPETTAADLSSGAEVPFVDLSAGTMTRVTSTPANALPRAGTAALSPFFSRDNDSPFINDNGTVVAFVSQARSGIPGSSNADGNREVFVFNRNTGAFVQVTTTADQTNRLIWSDNPQLSGDGAVLAFISNADIGSAEAEGNRGNGEIYVAGFTGSAVSNLRPVTRTPPDRRQGVEQSPVVLLSPGRRISQNGNLIAFESSAVIGADGAVSGDLTSAGIYVYNVSANAFALVGSRPPTGENDISPRFPTFSGDNSRVVFASTLNFKADGTVAAAGSSDGVNPNRRNQIFSAPFNASANTVGAFSRHTNTPVALSAFGGPNFTPALQPHVSNTVRRMAFAMAGVELGGGNTTLSSGANDGTSEAFYLLTPEVTGESPSSTQVAFFTGASERPVVAPSPAPTPPAVAGLAPGMLGIGRAEITLAPATREVNRNDARTDRRTPALPVELNGVSVSVSNAAAGLYFVAPNQINFVVPPGLPASTTAAPVVVFNNGTVTRSTLLIMAAQPDIFTSSNGPGGRAAVLNVTNPCVSPTGEPFRVTTTRPRNASQGDCSGTETETVPTELLIMLTGVRNVTRTQVTVVIGTTELTGDAIVSVGPSLTAGFDQIVVRLPASLAGAGDVPVFVTVNVGGTPSSSRPADTAPRITIQ